MSFHVFVGTNKKPTG